MILLIYSVWYYCLKLQLQNCICDGSENFNCQEIKRNMKKLCLETTTNENTSESTISMELTTISGIRNITSLSSDSKERERPIKISSKKSMISIVCTFYLSYLNYVIMYSLGTLLSWINKNRNRGIFMKYGRWLIELRGHHHGGWLCPKQDQ